MEVPMPTIEVNGSSFEYFESGSGTPLVLVHGSLNDNRAWESQVAALSAHYHVVTYSRRYHHPNPWVGDGSDYAVSLHAADLASLLRALDIAPAHLVGSSYGASTALIAGLHNPHLVRTLVLGEPPAVTLLVSNPANPLNLLWLLIRNPRTALVVLRFMLGTIRPTQEALRRGDLKEAVRHFGDGVLGTGGYDRLPSVAKSMIRDNAEALKAELLAGNFEPFPTAEARSFTNPVLLLYGEQSVDFFRLISDTLKTHLQNVETATIPGASHDMHSDNPGDYNDEVLRFLKKHSTARREA
jgi:non-heme chloroperoxidase